MIDEPVRALPTTAGAAVALTFDDGPSARFTDQILAGLLADQVPATFFVVGRQAVKRPDVIRRLAEAGMGVGVHTWDHEDLVGRDTGFVEDQLRRTVDLLADLGAVARLFRPPQTNWDQRTLDVAAALGLTCVTGSIVTEDWRDPGVEFIVRRVRKNVTAGSIVLMHDGGGDRSQTVTALPAVVEAVHAAGLAVVDLAGALSV